MPLHLSFPQDRRDRATSTKARSLQGDALRWARVYAEDLDDLAGEAPIVRFLDDALLRLGSKRGWLLPYDHRRIANRLTLPTRHVKPAIERLLELGRLELIEASDELSTGGNVQLGLGVSVAAGSSQGTPQGRRSTETVSSPGAGAGAESVSTLSAQIQASLDAAGATQGATVGATEGATAGPQGVGVGEERAFTSNGTVARPPAREVSATSATPHSRDIINKLTDLVCRGEHSSIEIIRHEAAGLPDAAIARTIESCTSRRPRPRDLASYAVGTLRALRTEMGITDTRPRIDREPQLGP